MESSKVLQNVLGSTVVATVLSALCAVVTWKIQDNAKQNEIALAEFRQNQAAQEKVVTETIGLIGTYMASIDDLITLTDSYFDVSQYTKEDRPALNKFFENTQNRHDEADVAWRTKKYTFGYSIAYHHAGDEVGGKWAALTAAVDGFEDCAGAWFKEHGRGSSDLRKVRPCAAEKKAVEDTMSSLTTALKDGHGK
jgi:hypothetical protein